ncbi:hypothetical protein SAMN02745127_00660 [Oceanospirillum multiglobuliferum]|nr:hypothetical protein SAMN02745127_00660 [Oceanospirillum multiglobuliferum]
MVLKWAVAIELGDKMSMLENKYSATQGTSRLVERRRYNYFLLVLPVFFIFPLALFSLQEWWQVWTQSSVTPSSLGMERFSDGIWAPRLTLAYAWTAFVQGLSWLGFVGFVVAGYLLNKGSLIRIGYVLFAASFLLQWQLPDYFAAVS